MFNSWRDEEAGRWQVGRIAMGLVWIGGAATLAARQLDDGRDMRSLFAWTWGLALAALIGGRVLAPHLPVPALRARRLRASLVVPAIGGALIIPLTLHLLAWPLLGYTAAEFDRWVAMSCVLAAAPHAALATLAAVRAADLAAGRPPVRVWVIFAAATAAANVPFPIVPAVIVAITGIPIVPMLVWLERIAWRERQLVAEPVPAAVAVAA